MIAAPGCSPAGPILERAPSATCLTIPSPSATASASPRPFARESSLASTASAASSPSSGARAPATPKPRPVISRRAAVGPAGGLADEVDALDGRGVDVGRDGRAVRGLALDDEDVDERAGSSSRPSAAASATDSLAVVLQVIGERAERPAGDEHPLDLALVVLDRRGGDPDRCRARSSPPRSSFISPARLGDAAAGLDRLLQRGERGEDGLAREHVGVGSRCGRTMPRRVGVGEEGALGDREILHQGAGARDGLLQRGRVAQRVGVEHRPELRRALRQAAAHLADVLLQRRRRAGSARRRRPARRPSWPSSHAASDETREATRTAGWARRAAGAHGHHATQNPSGVTKTISSRALRARSGPGGIRDGRAVAGDQGQGPHRAAGALEQRAGRRLGARLLGWLLARGERLVGVEHHLHREGRVRGRDLAELVEPRLRRRRELRRRRAKTPRRVTVDAAIVARRVELAGRRDLREQRVAQRPARASTAWPRGGWR